MDAFTPKDVAESFELGEPHRELDFIARGQSNTLGVCRLETDLGVFAVKRFTSVPRPVALCIEAAAFKAGVAMPRPILARHGAPYTRITDARRDVWVRVHEWIDGQPLDWGHVHVEDSFRVGQFMASVHCLSIEQADLCREGAPSTTSVTVEELTDLAKLAAKQRLPWAGMLREKIPVLMEHQAYTAANWLDDEPLVPSQQDLHPPNVIRSRDGKLAVVDWDSASPDFAGSDVAKYALVWATREDAQPDVSAVHAFIDGYRAAGGHFRSRGRAELTREIDMYLWWLLFNIRRDLSAEPGYDPTLTPALLSGISPIDIAGLELRAALLDY